MCVSLCLHIKTVITYEPSGLARPMLRSPPSSVHSQVPTRRHAACPAARNCTGLSISVLHRPVAETGACLSANFLSAGSNRNDQLSTNCGCRWTMSVVGTTKDPIFKSYTTASTGGMTVPSVRTQIIKSRQVPFQTRPADGSDKKFSSVCAQKSWPFTAFPGTGD